MKRKTHSNSGKPPTGKQTASVKYSKKWLHRVKLSKMSLLAASGSSDVLLADWGESGGITPGSDGTPGYSIYRGPQQSEETGPSIYDPGTNVTETGWNVIVQWEMDIAYLNSLPISNNGGVIGYIHQDRYAQTWDEDDNPSDVLTLDPDDFEVYCHVTPVRTGGGVIVGYDRSYSIPQDIFLIPDSAVLPADDNENVYASEWGEAYFVPVDTGGPVGDTVSRYLDVMRAEE